MINKRLVELEEQTKVKVDKLKAELAERDAIIAQLTAQLEEATLGTAVPSLPSSPETTEIMKQYEVQIANFDAEKEKLLNEISDLNSKINSLQAQIAKSAASAEKLQALEEQLGVFRGAFHCFRNSRHFGTVFRVQQFFNELELPLVYVAVL